jgi:alpha-amylase/alpha-mannosidase (GH57 family)
MTVATNQLQQTSQQPEQDLATATGVYITIHGHFYQPPRENPYLETIERQPSAYPFHNWNERIHHECYRPNAFARILNDEGEVMGIVNNFEYLSFNIGPTLMSWLEKYDLEVYQRILEADRVSCEKFEGHGNAIAQVYNHMILPLANERDKYTQIHWGIEDFRSRFQRDPEGMWLAEAAVDYPTLEALIDAGIKYIILAPSQAERCRPFPTEDNPDPQWREVGGGQIDPTRPYRCTVEDGRTIDIFFYDGPISADIGFDSVLSTSNNLVGRLGQAVRGDHRPAQLINIATDGETFGHHKAGTEKCIAYAFAKEFDRHHWTVTNYGYYRSVNPPTWEVVLKPVTAWSCSHGVDRWQDDCGCGGGGVWNQKWRKPLRETLNWLRDQLADLYETEGRKLFQDPWQARNEFIEVMRNRDQADTFLSRHQSHPLSDSEKVDALRLLEMQRHTLLMFTSCGWFFEEISRPEGVQILRYAARAIELAGEVAGVRLDQEFVSRLEAAPSNVHFGDGAEIFRQLVVPSQITFEQVAAHYALSSFFTTFAEEQRVYCYQAHQLDYEKQQMGTLTLAVGQLRLVSEITQESSNLVFAVLHLGGWDFHCCIQPFQGRRLYQSLKDELFAVWKQGSAAQVVLSMSDLFSGSSYSLQDLFAEERHRIMEQLTQETKNRLDQLYTQVYRDNYGILGALHRDRMPVPQELQVAADIALSHRCALTVKALETAADDLGQVDSYITELAAIATEAKHFHCQLNVPEAKVSLEQLILRSLWQLLHSPNLETLEDDIQRLETMIEVGYQLDLGLAFGKGQELYYDWLHHTLLPQFPGDWDIPQLRRMLQLGEKLAVEVSPWLDQL